MTSHNSMLTIAMGGDLHSHLISVKGEISAVENFSHTRKATTNFEQMAYKGSFSIVTAYRLGSFSGSPSYLQI